MTGADAMSRVTAVVVTWNGRELIDGCLESVFGNAPLERSIEVVVVDNASTDGTAAHVRERWPAVRLIANTENAGYTRANNQAIRATQGDYLLLINADARLEPGCADLLIAALERDRRGAIAGPRLVFGDGSWQRWTAGRSPSLAAAANHYLFLDRLSPRLRGLYLSSDVREPGAVDWVSSACLVARRDAVEEVGLMDEGFFVYMDDVDLCQRVRDRGWRVWYEPRAQAVHFMGRSTRPLPGSIAPDALRNFNRYFAQRHGRVRELALRGIEALGFALRIAAYRARAAARGDPAASEKARMHLAYLRLVLGLTPTRTSRR